MSRTLATSAAALILSAGTVLADITPQQVWQSLADYYETSGYTVAVGKTDDAGSTLTLTDITLTMDSEQTDSTVTIPKLTFQQTGDAKVRSVMDGEMVITTSAEVPDSEPVSFDMYLDAPGNETVSSGSPEDMLHEFVAPNVTLKAGSAETPVDGDKAPVLVHMADLKGQYSTKAGEIWEIAGDMTGGKIEAEFSATAKPDPDQPNSGGTFTMNMNVDGFTSKSGGTIPADAIANMDRLDLALNAGMAFTGDITLGKITGTSEISEAGASGPGNMNFSMDDAKIDVGLSNEGLSYVVSATNSKIDATLPDVPVPISYGVAKSSGELTVPVSKSEDLQPFKLSYLMEGLTYSDEMWNMFDPGKQLPHDPARVEFDLEGETIVKESIFDPDFAQQNDPAANDATSPDSGDDATDAQPEMEAGAPTPPMPYEPKSVKINRINLSMIGAEADLTGEVTFPRNVQEPVGKIDGDFTGVNTLLDKLVAMGLVPQEQVMGARMMMAMFAKPVDGDSDHLRTELEFKEGGAIFANGQQIK